MNHATLVAITGTLISLSSIASGQVSATFEYIVDPVTKFAGISANDMSADGRWIVGSMDTDGDYFPDTGYRWDRVNNVFTLIDGEPIGTGVEIVQAVSDDGAVVLGNVAAGIDGVEHTAGIWTDADGWTSLGFLPNAGSCPSRSSGYEISSDGTVAVGLSWDGCSSRGFRWTESTGMLELENLAFGNNRASVMSSDGSVIAGFAQGLFNRTPATWNGNTLEGALLDPTAEYEGEFQGMSDDGSIVLGSWWFGDADSQFDAAKIVDGVISRIGEGSLLPGWQGVPLDIADNGTVVGFDILQTSRRAWIQPNGEGDLQVLLQWLNDLGANIPMGTTLEVIQAISADGKYIIGHGGGAPAWLVTLEYECPADFTDDGVLDFFDISGFLNAFSMNNPSADLNEDGLFDFFDVSEFLNQFNAGCP